MYNDIRHYTIRFGIRFFFFAIVRPAIKDLINKSIKYNIETSSLILFCYFFLFLHTLLNIIERARKHVYNNYRAVYYIL